MMYVDAKLIPVAQANPGTAPHRRPGTYPGQVMQTDAFPFDDNRVRQAFRLMINREEMIKVALGGYGKIGNDFWHAYDPDYAREILSVPTIPTRRSSLSSRPGEREPPFRSTPATSVRACSNPPSSSRNMPKRSASK